MRRIVEKSGKKREDVFKNNEFDPFSVMGIDTIAIAPRHMIRAPYSLNEKKWLVSLPIHEKQLPNFTQEMAKPENVAYADIKFLGSDAEAGSAAQLLVEAMDWWYTKQIAQKAGEKASIVAFEFSEKVPKERFPPCMQLILKGLEDGRKRGLFALINFMKLAKWNWIEIESELKEWNNRNAKPLKSGYLQAQLSWHRRHAEKIPPPNCRDFYKDIAVCKPDFTCDRIKNPISYPRFYGKNRASQAKTA